MFRCIENQAPYSPLVRADFALLSSSDISRHNCISLFRGHSGSHLELSSLQVNGSPKSSIELNFELRHLFAKTSKLVFELGNVVLEPCGRCTQHFLGLWQRDVKESIADLITALMISISAYQST